MDDCFDFYKLSDEMSKKFEWKKWIPELPLITFGEGWKVKIIPPFRGAIIRFRIYLEGSGNDFVSVYLDGYDLLGSHGEPYWEIYPFDEDVARVDFKDEKKLKKTLDEAVIQLLERVKK